MDEAQFSYRITKDRKVFIEWHGRPVTVLKGRQAEKLALAKATGNERPGS